MNIKYKILLGILFIYIIVVGISLYYYNSSKINFYLSPNLSFEYNKGKIQKIDFKENIIYNIYEDNIFTYKGKLKIENDSVYYNNIELKNVIAVNKNINILDFETQVIDYEIARNILESFELSDFTELTIANKIDIDYDNDGTNEIIYCFSNVFSNELQNQIFTILYTIDNNEINVLYKQIFGDDIKGCVGYISNIVDINNDNKYELLFKCTYFDKKGTILQIYDLKNNKYELIGEI